MPMPNATTHTCSPKCTPSIINATRSSPDRSAASSSASAVSVAATNRRLTADLLVTWRHLSQLVADLVLERLGTVDTWMRVLGLPDHAEPQLIGAGADDQAR